MVSELVEFLVFAGKLKRVLRSGWERKGVPCRIESVADHSYRVALMAISALPSGEFSNFDRVRCIKMGLVHDLSEALVGDITPFDGISKELKREMEESAMLELMKRCENASFSEEIYQLWLEYDAGKTIESRLVKDFDKLEMLFTALEYEHEMQDHSPEFRVNLDEFWTSVNGKFHSEIALQIQQALLSRRFPSNHKPS